MNNENSNTVTTDAVTGGNEKTKKGKSKIAIIVGGVVGGVIILGLVLFFFVFAKTCDLLIPVSNDGERWGFINREGEFIINPQFESADFFSDGLARVRSGGRMGYINKRGEFVIPAAFRDGTPFNDGAAFVVSDGGHPTAIDREGNVLFILSAAEHVSVFSDGLAMFIAQNGQHGFVDTRGTVVISPQFDRATPFHGGFARIWRNDEVGFIDRNGGIAINPQFATAGNFHDGLASFLHGQQWGFVNTTGGFAINPQFEGVNRFNEGFAPVRQGRSWGYIDRTGRVVVNPQFDNASPFSGGLAAVQVAGQWGYINTSGRYEINPQFEEAGNFQNGVALVRAAGRWGLINMRGQYVVNPQFRYVVHRPAPGAHPHLVRNEFYDASAFITEFFRRETRDTFSGINASTTLSELSEHPVYGAGLNAQSEHLADFHQRIQVTDDISIGYIGFHFDTPIFRWVNTYNDWGQVMRRNQQFDFNATPTAIAYHFVLGGRAHDRQNAVVSALRAEIEHRQEQQMRSRSLGHGHVIYYLPQPDGRLSFAIDATNIILHVAFNRGYVDRLFQ